MRFVLIVFVCLLVNLSIVAQTENQVNKTENGIKILTLARADAGGNIEEDIVVFKPNDIPIHCYIDLESSKPTTVKMNLIAVKAKGLRPNTKIVIVSYKTKNSEDSVFFNATPEKFWQVGDYRVDILLNGKLAKSLEFTVVKDD